MVELVKKTVSLKKLNHPESDSIMMMITVGPGRQMGVWEERSKAYCDHRTTALSSGVGLSSSSSMDVVVW